MTEHRIEILSQCCGAILVPETLTNHAFARCASCGKRYRIVECEEVSQDVRTDPVPWWFGSRRMRDLDYKDEHLKQKEQQHKKRNLITIEDDGESFKDYVNRVFWRPHKMKVCLLVLLVIATVMYTSGVLSTTGNPDSNTPPWWWWFWFH